MTETKVIVKHVLVTDYESKEFETLVAFKPYKYNKGKLISLEPVKSAREKLNKYKSWQVVGEAFISHSIVSDYGSCVICNKGANKLSNEGICENCL